MMRFPIVALVGTMLMAAPAALAAEADMDVPCAPHEEITKSLSQIHAERPVSQGIDARGVMVEVFVAPAGTWTIVVTEPGGMSCLMAAGEAWESLPSETAGVLH